jgi:general secretion pathway protein J
MTRTPRRCRTAGFTLIELLVALAVAGLVSLLLVHGIGLAAFGFERLSRGAARLDENRGVDQVLRRTLGSAAAIPGIDAGIGFAGGAARVAFLSLVADTGPGLYRIELGLDPGGGESRLVLTRRHAGPGAEARIERSVLARGVRTFRIAYYGAATLNEDPSWHDRWSGLGYLPKLIRIELETGDGTVRPPLIVRMWDAG